MTVSDAYKLLKTKLKEANIDDYIFDSDCLLEFATGYRKIDRLVKSNDILSNVQVDSLNSLIDKRISGEPLQYIIGEWDFMDLTFKVGKGVLIPRPETEMLVETVNCLLSGCGERVVYDLCSGTGCIGLSIAKHNPKCKVYLFEKFDEALKYTNINLKALGINNAQIIKCDVLNGLNENIEKPDIIVSNPPYIKSDDIDALQEEVHNEPATALDGGSDGLNFYKAICQKWLKLLGEDGVLLLECGDGQSKDVMSIFSPFCKKENVMYDFNDIDRVVQIKV